MTVALPPEIISFVSFDFPIFAEARENEKSHLREPVHIPEIELRRDGEPLHRQIADQIAESIRKGRTRAGARLPATRVLAALLGVSRNTVLTAYEELVARQCIEGTQGSGMRVTERAMVPNFDVAAVLKEAQYPARRLFFEDPDGNALAVNY